METWMLIQIFQLFGREHEWKGVVVATKKIEWKYLLVQDMNILLQGTLEQENEPPQVFVDTMKLDSLQACQTYGAIFIMWMNVFRSNIRKIHCITNHWCMLLTDARQLTIDVNEHEGT